LHIFLIAIILHYSSSQYGAAVQSFFNMLYTILRRQNF